MTRAVLITASTVSVTKLLLPGLNAYAKMVLLDNFVNLIWMNVTLYLVKMGENVYHMICYSNAFVTLALLEIFAR